MRFALRHWRPRHLIGAWGAWWASLALATVGPGVLAAWRATRVVGGHSSMSASFGDGAFHLSVLLDGVTTWAGSASMTSVVLWTCGPPLLLWVAWLARRPRPDAGLMGATERSVASATARPALSEPSPADSLRRQAGPAPERVRRDQPH
jgi:hypothetical protein